MTTTPNPLRRAEPKRRPRYSAAYYPTIGHAPDRACRDKAAAWAYLTRILRALGDETLQLTHNDRGNLQRLEKRWRRRATGEDQRWIDFGARPGRLPKAVESRYVAAPAPHPAWMEPIESLRRIQRPVRKDGL